MFSAMKRPEEGGKERPAKKPRTLPPIGEVAKEDRDVFMSLQGSSERVGKEFEGRHNVVFIRSGVATGKTTFAEHLAGQFPDKYVKVPFTGAGKESVWRIRTIEAIEKATDTNIDRDDLAVAFAKSLTLAKEKELTLIYDEAHTLFASSDLCSALFKGDTEHRPNLLLFSASGDASRSENLTVATPSEITRKFMWAPPLIYTNELGTQLEAAGVRLDQQSIEFFILFSGGHRGIFMAAMHWVHSKQNADESWDFEETVARVRRSYGTGDWNCADTEILAFVRKSRAVRVNGRFTAVQHIPHQFAELLCKGATSIAKADVRRELSINGFVLPQHDKGSEEEFQPLDWNNAHMKYQVANPLLASYYRFTLEKHCSLEVGFEASKPRDCADLLMRALPYMFFAQVVCSSLSKELLPYEGQYNKCFQSSLMRTLSDGNYSAFEFLSSSPGEGKPDCAVQIEEETFVLEGVMHVRGQADITKHRQRFDDMCNYKNAKHKGLYIIGNNNEKMLETVRKTEGDDVQIIGLVPNIAHTAYTVHVKSKGIEHISTFRVDCDLVARRLVLKDDGEPELYSVQSLKSVNLSPKAQSSPSAGPAGTTSSSVVWVRELARKDGTVTAKSRQDPEGEDELEPAFQVKSPQDYPDLNNADDLKKAIKQMNPDLKDIAPRHIDIYLQEAGAWRRIKDESEVLRRDTTRLDCYGFLPWQRT
ncbi:unnamed protein product [Symbiodinium sp. CCMP2592]|nr:unnamed protein product [Symbiodinium sp. CCMP2592]